MTRSASDDDLLHTLTTIDGVDVDYVCEVAAVYFQLEPASATDTVSASGNDAVNGTLASLLTTGAPTIATTSGVTVNLDVVTSAESVDTFARVDLGGYNTGGACKIWGLVIPGGGS